MEATQPKQKAEVVQISFTNPFCKVPPQHYDKCDDPLVSRIKTVEVKDSKTLEVAPVFEQVDLMEEVRASADLAGVDYMKRLLATGQAQPEDFYDDGKSGVDLRMIPETVHDAAKASEQIKNEIAEVAKVAGVPDDEKISGSQLEKYVAELVAKQFAAQQSNKKEGE